MAESLDKRGELKKDRTSTGRRQQYVNLVMESFESSRDTFAPYYRKTSRWYRLYRTYRQGRMIPFRNNIALPLTFGIVQSDASKKVNLLLGQQPYTKFLAVGPEDQILARKREALINLQMEDAKTFDKGTRLFTGAAIFGTQPYKWFWNTKHELIQFRADFGAGEQEFSGEETTFDGPDWEPIDVRNFFPAPGFPRIGDMPWVVERFFLEKEDVNRLSEGGYFDRQGAGEVNLADINPAPSRDEDFWRWDDPASGGLEKDFKKANFQQPIEIFEWWGRVPRALSIDGQVNLVITVAAGRVLLRARINPHGKIPFGAYSPMPDPRYFHGPSKVEVAEKLQVASNALASQKMDAMDLFASPQFLYNKRGIVDPRRLRARPGAWHGFDGPVDDSQVRPLIPDLRGLVNVYTELEQQSRWMQQGTGIIEDTVQGLGASSRTTAREFQGRQESAGTRLLMESRIAEKQWLEPLAMEFVRLDRQFLDFPRQVRMLGASAILDPITLQAIPQESDFIGVNDMLPDYEARAVGSTRAIGQAAMQQNMIMLLQVAQTNPVAIQVVNWFAFFRQLFQVFEMPNVDELMGSDSLVQAAVQNALAQMGPGNGAAGATNALPTQPSQADLRQAPPNSPTPNIVNFPGLQQ